MTLDDLRVQLAELRIEMRSVSMDIQDLQERVEAMQKHFAATSTVTALDSEVGSLRAGQVADGLRLENLATTIKVVAAIGALLVTIALAVTPYVIKGAMRDVTQEIWRANNP